MNWKIKLLFCMAIAESAYEKGREVVSLWRWARAK